MARSRKKDTITMEVRGRNIFVKIFKQMKKRI
jgi:hypothetical protein